ncbi:MAG: prenyltransferase/squalene oxidase repeat-containing protein [Pirellulaceae bacterium]|nr:prenyltransferase/squalene oxidase repeat-containing protein [Pirellulaceae bacterium]MDP7019079.1 prenyltransferase/squalene oxidase repeat-containing protein [Pirellulaceae bacterium]
MAFREKPEAERVDAPHTGSTDLDLLVAARGAAERTTDWLLANQGADGHWCGELEGDSILQSEYILLLAWLEREDSETAAKASRRLLEQQTPDGGWALYPGGPIDISASVKAYFALKLTGHDADSEPLSRARQRIRDLGGADAVNSFTRFYLALLGQISYDQCPAVPPEAMLLPKWFPVNIYRVSAWSRTILIPLAIMWAHRPVRKPPAELGIDEIMLAPPDQWPRLRRPGAEGRSRLLSWETLFCAVDAGLKCLERFRIRPCRRWALRLAERWMLRRFAYSDGLGAIFPPIVWSAVALKCLGYQSDSPEMNYCLNQLDALIVEDDESLHLQPCMSPVWDTALSLRALQMAGEDPASGGIRRATRWLLDKEVGRRGDWSETVAAEPSGWCFEYNNEFYPDVDDTIMVMMALRGHLNEDAIDAGSAGAPFVAEGRVATVAQAKREAAWLERVASAGRRGREWVLAMQNRDGGWGAFDRNNNAEFLCHVPFADHNAMIDPSTPDITARVLECLAQWGMSAGHRAVDRALVYLRRQQQPDGSWPGRWGVNHIYGTWQGVVGMAAAGVDGDDPSLQLATGWLLDHQQEHGGWGESADSYAHPELRGQGPATASQTAWALLGLLAAGQSRHPAVQRGVRYLIDEQNESGVWDEPEFTGTGFPLVFYLRYHYYPIYFPLMAIAEWAAANELEIE